MITTKPKSVELKACPFCGGKAALVRDFQEEQKLPFWEVHCQACYLGTRIKKQSIAAWNRRDDARLRLLEGIAEAAWEIHDDSYGAVGLLYDALAKLAAFDKGEAK